MHAEASVNMFPPAEREAQLFVGQRVCMPGPSRKWNKLKRDGKALVFEIDDDLWNVHPSNKAPYKFFGRPDVRERLTHNVKISDLVTVTNEHLADEIRKINPNVVVLPNVIAGHLLEHERERTGKLTIGWAGSSTHEGDLKVAASHVRRFLSKNPFVDMHFIGTDYSKMIGREARFTPWTDEVTSYQRSIDFDIGLAPLERTHFNASKSYVKALEYAALGIPIVASDYGPYHEFVEHGVTGFLVKTDFDWMKYLRILVEDEDLRLAMGKAARAKAAEFTMEKNAYLWRDAYCDLVGAKAPESV
jgi:glycosyltransferase involved in cell wall biosynthesis